MLEMREADSRTSVFGNAVRPGEPERGAAGGRHRQTTLSNACLRVDIEAGCHSGIAQFEWNDRGMWTPVFRSAQRQASLSAPRRLACQPSIWIPGITNELMDDWKIDSVGENALRLETEVAQQYSAAQTYALDGPTLEITVELENRGRKPLVCGIEIRPALVRDPDTRISAPAGGIWIARGTGVAPRLVPAPFAWQFGVTYPLPEKAVDHAFTGWGGRALVEWPARQFSLAIVGNTDCYRLRALPEEDSFLFQLMNDQSEHGYVRGANGVNGLTTLAAGETLSRRVSFTVERLASLTKTARYATQ